MRALLVSLVCIVVTLPALRAGTISGRVRGEAPAVTSSGGGGAYDSRRYKFVERVDYDKLVDFVVYIDQPVPGGDSTAAAAVTTQKDASFDPRVLPVAVGTTVRWPNQDDIYHNVFSLSEAKMFDLGNYKGDEVREVLFDKAGRVDVFCGLHTKMHCIILVVPNPYFAKSDAKGRYTIRQVPAGTYQLKAWHERLPPRVLTVVVPEQGDVNVDFVLSFGHGPKS